MEPITEDDDLVLLDRWSAGDAVAGNLLFKRHFPSLYRLFEHKAAGEVDDLVQETFLQCLKSRAGFQHKSRFRTYLFGIARNVLLGHWRKQVAAAPTLDFEEVSIASLSTSVGTRLVQRQERANLLAVLRTLPLDQQLLLEMYYWQDLDREQLAEVFGVETATIGSRLFRARQALQDALRATGGAAVPGDQLDDWARALSDDL
jgi:RNA polymerase sigma-70 factor, ECF subfamily